MPGQGDQVRLGQSAYNTFGFKGFQQDAHLDRAGAEAQQHGAVVRVHRWDAARDRVRLGAQVVERVAAARNAQIVAEGTAVQGQRGAERFRHAALHLGEAHLQHDLLRTANRHQVGHPFRRVTFRKVKRALKFLGARHRARQDDPVIGGAHLDLFAGQDLAQAFLEFADICRDADIHVGNQLPAGVEQGQRGDPRRLAQHVDRALGQR